MKRASSLRCGVPFDWRAGWLHGRVVLPLLFLAVVICLPAQARAQSINDLLRIIIPPATQSPPPVYRPPPVYQPKPSSNLIRLGSLETARFLVNQAGFRPSARALRATRPAASMRSGLEVFVQLVIAINTAPSPSPRSRRRGAVVALPANSGSSAWKLTGTLHNATRSCGLRGPAKLISTLPRANSISCV